jgi:DNA-binding winged helix-turn-helix (wHTH) protein
VEIGVRVEVLGPLVMRRGDEPEASPARRQRLLLSVLVANAPHTVPLARLVDALWSDGDEPTDPANTVQQYVAHLRRALRSNAEGPAIVTSPPGYSIDLPPGTADAVDASDLLGEARAAAAEGDDARAVIFASRALALWRGTPFEEFADHPALRREIDRLDGLRLSCAEVLNVAWLRRRAYDDIVAFAVDHPGWWVGRAQLAVAYVASLAHLDRQADALAAAEQHRAELAARGLEPQPGFVQMVNDIATKGRPDTSVPDLDAFDADRDQILRQLLTVLPALDDRSTDESSVDYHLAVARAMNVPAMSNDVANWLGQLQRHQPGFASSLDRAVREAPGRGLELALELTRFWDWTGRHDELRLRLERLLRALPDVDHPRRAEASSWLAFSWADTNPSLARRHLDDALEASQHDPGNRGRTRAVESVLLRPDDSARASAAAQEAVGLLRRHGTPDEAAYAHIVAALADLESGDKAAAELHAARAGELYSELADPRGLVWVDIISARLEERPSPRAAAFGRDHHDRPTQQMLD